MDEYRRHNLRAAYEALEEMVLDVLRIQRRDHSQLQNKRRECLEFLHSAHQHQQVFSNDEFLRLCQNVHLMLDDLEKAGQTEPETHRPALKVVQLGASTVRGGRRPIVIDEDFLAQAVRLRGPSQIAKALGCSARTIRRRILELQLAPAGPAVFQVRSRPDGWEELERNNQCGRSTHQTEISDEDLDSLTFAILQLFPRAGRSMTMGQLASQGVRVSRTRLRSSLLRVRGAPLSFGQRRIARKKYWVPAVNSLWHHDGQHGLIRWKLVTHAFIDGKSRFVTGLGVHNNNRAHTVLSLFLAAATQFGVPSRVRGDHGVENVKVAEAMEEIRGPGRGSYIFGRSIHNTRIERLWLDWTQGLGLKWYDFFMALEQYYELDVDDDVHIWLLHHLFLRALNEEAQDWVNTWNFHILQIRGEPNRSPADIFFFNQIEEGVYGLPLADLADYGVDHGALRNEEVMSNFFANNEQERLEIPENMNTVICESPECPLLPVQVLTLDEQLEAAQMDAQCD
ncbi:hypothetical protein MIND_00015900 [Mycena indigotica]|uniref:Integrase catalytic domain-containing protein n=1 Tax=Mycena indigotica TaxID=2126181 RepID=A0A8H6WEN9_9AGAR|nr:uncharacterized protein MIND_00015900 [Mycena indigotica]KAF7315017.1 hypothetical protein MIND_00015900 [Mycena indigotica]